MLSFANCIIWCTFDNISIKLTRTVCIFCRMSHVIFTKFSIIYIFFLSSCSLFIFHSVAYSLSAYFFLSLSPFCCCCRCHCQRFFFFIFVSSFESSVTFLSFASQLMLPIQCCLLSIGNRDIFIRFRFCLHFLWHPQDPFRMPYKNSKSSSGCGAFNKSKCLCVYANLCHQNHRITHKQCVNERKKKRYSAK